MEATGTERNVGPDGHPAYLLPMEMSQRYRHVVGFSSRFYAGLEHGVLRATRCDRCGASWLPPRRFCPSDLSDTTWYDLPGTGTVVAATRVHIPPPFGGIDPPYILASIRLDGVDAGLTHRVIGSEIPQRGTVVTVTFLNPPPDHPLLSFAFAIKGAGS